MHAIPVSDPGDPRLADYVRLTDVRLRTSLEAEHGLFIAEGTKVITRAVRAGYRVRSMLLAESRLADLPALDAGALEPGGAGAGEGEAGARLSGRRSKFGCHAGVSIHVPSTTFDGSRSHASGLRLSS